MRLTPNQRTLLRLMDDGPEEDSVGLPLQSLTPRQLHTADSLVDRGFAKLWIGRFDTDYYRLTEAGREAMAELDTRRT